MPKPTRISLLQIPGRVHESKPRYLVLRDGASIGELYPDGRGYNGCCIPFADGTSEDLGGLPLARFREAIRRANNSFNHTA